MVKATALAVVTLTLGACTSIPSGPASAPTSCSLKQGPDVILWMKAPNLPDSAQLLGNVDYGLCKSTADALAQTSPTAAGFCSQLAATSDNPGYNVDAKPAPRLKKVIVSAGPAC